MNRLAAVAALCAALCSPSCVTAAGGEPLVVYADVTGDGGVWFDGNAAIVVGSLKGSAGIYMKGSGFPLTLPLEQDEDVWTAANRRLGIQSSGKLGVDPLPYWTRELFRPGQVEALFQRLGLGDPLFDPQPVKQ